MREGVVVCVECVVGVSERGEWARVRAVSSCGREGAGWYLGKLLDEGKWSSLGAR